MFIVYGYKPEEEMDRWAKRNPKKKGESAEQYETRKKAAADNFKGHKLMEYSVQSSAEDYRDRITQKGYVASVKFYKLVKGSGKKKVSRVLCDLSELPRIDTQEQSRLSCYV